MKRHAWISYRRGEDRRERWVCLAPGGKAQVRRVEPAWEKVQSQLRRQWGGRDWNSFLEFTRQVTSLRQREPRGSSH
jgi:hypothetical protein